MSKRIAQRAPLRAIILTATSQDVRKCMTCGHCEEYLQPEMDLSFRELLDAARRNDLSCLQSKTLWNCDSLLHDGHICSSGIEIAAIIHVLRKQAILIGMHPGKRSG